MTTHSATSNDEKKMFDTGEVKPGETSRPVTFEQDGTFKYHCNIHGKVMSGKMVVAPAGGL